MMNNMLSAFGAIQIGIITALAVAIIALLATNILIAASNRPRKKSGNPNVIYVPIERVPEETAEQETEPETEESVTEEPATTAPVTEEPATEEITATEPVEEEPTTEEIAVSETAEEEPAAEEPVLPETAVAETETTETESEETLIEETVQEEPLADEIAVTEITEEESVAEETAVVEPVMEEPVTEETSVIETVVEESEVKTVAEPVFEEITPEQEEVYRQLKLDRSFTAKLVQTEEDTKAMYVAIKNELLSYKAVGARMSWRCETYRKGRTVLAKFGVRGKTLCLYLALDPAEYADSKYKIEVTPGSSVSYADTPLMYRIKNEKRVRYAKELISAMMENKEIERIEREGQDYGKELAYRSTPALIDEKLIRVPEGLVLPTFEEVVQSVEEVHEETPVEEVETVAPVEEVTEEIAVAEEVATEEVAEQEPAPVEETVATEEVEPAEEIVAPEELETVEETVLPEEAVEEVVSEPVEGVQEETPVDEVVSEPIEEVQEEPVEEEVFEAVIEEVYEEEIVEEVFEEVGEFEEGETVEEMVLPEEAVNEVFSEPVELKKGETPKNRRTRVRRKKKVKKLFCAVYTATLNRNFQEGETVTLSALIAKRIVPKGTIKYKVIMGGTITKALVVEANAFSSDAVEAIRVAGGKAVKVL